MKTTAQNRQAMRVYYGMDPVTDRQHQVLDLLDDFAELEREYKREEENNLLNANALSMVTKELADLRAKIADGATRVSQSIRDCACARRESRCSICHTSSVLHAVLSSLVEM